MIYITTPAFFLWALDAKTGRPLDNWGASVPLTAFSETGVIDLIPPLVADWGRWQDRSGSYEPGHGIPRELGMVTSSSPPIVVNGVVVVLVGHEPSYGQTRIENVPGRSGGAGWSIQMVMGDLLVQTRALSEGTRQIVPDAPVELHGRDKLTGEILGSVSLPAPGQYGMMTYMHQGKQYIVVQIGSVQTDFPGSLVALALP